jgi:AcrR family transcriptional regulator
MSNHNTAPRDRILSVAGPLFRKEGFRAIGVDRVIAEANVAKATFYRHFPSKDDLIVAFLENSDRFLDQWMDGATAGAADPIEALFEATAAMARRPECFGCTFQGVSAEFTDVNHPGHAYAKAYKQRVLARLERMADHAKAAEPRVLAEQLYLLLEGAWASVRIYGRAAPLAHLVEAARALTAAARRRGSFP